MNCDLMGFFRRNMNVVIVVLYAYILINHVGDKDYATMVVCTGATLLAICYLKKKKATMEGLQTKCGAEGFENPDTDATDATAKSGSQVIRELPANMGPYDGLCLKTGNKESWMPAPNNVQLVPNDALYSYLGSQGPMKPVFSDNTALTGPPIEGDAATDPKKMFILANNRTSPNCCPSTFSSSTGCVCTTEKQRDYIANRGHNKGEAASLEDF